MRKRLWYVVLSGLALLGAGGGTSGCMIDDCSNVECAPCEEPITLRLTETGGGVPNVDPATITLEGTAGAGVSADGSCVAETTEIVCTFFRPVEADAHGTWNLTITAPGYAPVLVDVLVPEDASDDCCSCGYVAQDVDVELTAMP